MWLELHSITKRYRFRKAKRQDPPFNDVVALFFIPTRKTL